MVLADDVACLPTDACEADSVATADDVDDYSTCCSSDDCSSQQSGESASNAY